jgi:uncharacterized Tic20 family protein
MGPVEFDELRRLVAAGSITGSTWVHDPSRATWVEAAAIPGLVDSATASSAPSPSGASPGASSPEFLFCRFCGERHAIGIAHCPACGRSVSAAAISGLDPKLAAVLCRASIIASVAIPVATVVVPVIVWVVGKENAGIVREAKSALNCHITMLAAWLFSLIVGLVGLLVIVGPFIAAGILAAVFVYAAVVGILGLVASVQDRPFRYPLTIPFIK